MLKHIKEEEISAYIRRFELVCTRFFGTMFNDVTLNQFFIQIFLKARTIGGVFERNLQTLADAKLAARELEHIDRYYKRLWKIEDESIPQFIPIRSRVAEGEPCRYGSQAPYALIDSGPRPLAVREPTPLLTLPASRVDADLEEVERRLGASHLEFEEAMIKHMQSLTNHISLMIRSQHLGLPPSAKLGRHALELWCVQCGQRGYTKQFCNAGHNRDQKMNGGLPLQNQSGQGQSQYGQGNYRRTLLEEKLVITWRERSSTFFVEGGMPKVNVGLKVRIMGVVFMEEIIPGMSVISLTRSLAYLTLWPTHTNRLETT
jgi:hypothetical protein